MKVKGIEVATLDALQSIKRVRETRSALRDFTFNTPYYPSYEEKLKKADIIISEDQSRFDDWGSRMPLALLLRDSKVCSRKLCNTPPLEAIHAYAMHHVISGRVIDCNI